MKYVVGFLKSRCKSGSRLFPNNRLFFAFEIIGVLVDFERDEQSDHFYRNYSVYEPIDAILESDLTKLNIRSINLTTSKLSGYNKGDLFAGGPYSISWTLFYFLNKLHAFSDSIIDEYWFEEIEVDTADFKPNDFSAAFTFKIKINIDFCNDISFFRFLLQEDNQILTSNFLPIKEYLPYYGENLYTSFSLRILVTNTKVRRIGYLKLLTDLTSSYRHLDKVIVFKKFEEIASKYENQLLLYKNTKGLIKITKTGNSARPYIELAEDLGFLSYLNRVYSIGKFFKVYERLQQEVIHVLPKETIYEDSKNIFVLNKLDKLFLLEEILKSDFFYITSLLEIIFVLKKTTEGELKKVEKNKRCYFQNFLLNKLEDLLIRLPRGDDIKVQKVKKRIENWEKPKVYLEHVLMPRLNWLLDFGLIALSDKSEISISNRGEILMRHLSSWYDIANGRISSPSVFLNKFYVFMFDDVFYRSGMKTSDNLLDKKIEIYLEDCFKYFQTLAPNRVTSSQAITYVRYKFYLIDEIIVEHSKIVEYLKGEQKNYIFTFHRQYNDGYIQKAH